MDRIVEGRWFALAELALVFFCGVACFIWPQLGGWPLLLALIPWLLRLFARQPLLQRTPLDIPILLFVATALVGAWAAYDTHAGLAKLWMVLIAVLLYYTLARQPSQDLWVVAGALSILGALLALYFLLTHNWVAQPADLDIINRLGSSWMSIRPSLPLGGFHPNKAGGLLAMLAPFSLALVLQAWRERDVGLGIFANSAAVLVLLGLLFTSSRAAWVALAVALGLWYFWVLACGFLSRRLRVRPVVIFGLGVGLALVGGFALVASHPVGISGLLNQLPGPNSAASRMEIYTNTRWLVSDYPFTGGGLASFPGLYSRYVMNVPFFLFGYAHEFFLDLALEQGIIGLLSFVYILGTSFWLIIGRESSELLDGAVLAGLAVMVLHGLVDDPLYAERGTPLLFLLPGFAVALALTEVRSRRRRRSLLKKGKAWWGWAALGVLVFVYLASVIVRTGGSAWFENRGTLQMGRSELAGFPTGEWEDGSILPQLAPAETLFEQALARDSHNFPAHYRLGLIATLRGDFPAACQHLEQALSLAPDHRGVRKALAYCYVWLGNYEHALKLLQFIPEARSEMEAYSSWWITQGRNDLAAQAAQMARLLP
jgi:tetratricopeptide (TPR) repeat protein